MTPGLTSYDVVIFDCDGVLVDSEPISVDVEARMLTELGWPITVEDVIARWMGRTSRAQLLEVTERLGAAASEELDRRGANLRGRWDDDVRLCRRPVHRV